MREPYRGTRKRVKVQKLNSHRLSKCNMHLIVTLEIYTRGVIRPWRHIFKREYDEILDILIEQICNLRPMVVRDTAIHHLMCTDFKRNRERRADITFHLPLNINRKIFIASIKRCLKGIKAVRDCRVMPCSPHELPYEIGRMNTYISDPA